MSSTKFLHVVGNIDIKVLILYLTNIIQTLSIVIQGKFKPNYIISMALILVF